ncbi:MAG: GMP/IMP nucleotidase [Pseudomonadales bacterium]|nr:GMP/IMP nucleotidase [Pseudomonadales bacterium]
MNSIVVEKGRQSVRPDWAQIHTVLLDMDCTLLDLCFDNFFWQTHLPRRFAALKGMTEAEALALLERRFAEEHGRLNWYCLDFWQQELQLDILALKREISHLIGFRPHVPAFLDALAAAGKQVWLVTNAHADSIRLKMERVPFAHWFERVISSHELGAAKESPAFWRALQERHPFDVAHTLFVDDTLSVLAAAQAYGVRYLLCVNQPDSRLPPRAVEAFPSVTHFHEILPVL